MVVVDFNYSHIFFMNIGFLPVLAFVPCWVIAKFVYEPYVKKLAKEERRHITILQKESSRRCQLTSPVSTGRYDMDIGTVNIYKNNFSMLSFAMKKEKSSAKLYRDLANLAKNKSARELFVWLAEEELEHEKQLGLEYNNYLK